MHPRLSPEHAQELLAVLSKREHVGELKKLQARIERRPNATRLACRERTLERLLAMTKPGSLRDLLLRELELRRAAKRFAKDFLANDPSGVVPNIPARK